MLSFPVSYWQRHYFLISFFIYVKRLFTIVILIGHFIKIIGEGKKNMASNCYLEQKLVVQFVSKVLCDLHKHTSCIHASGRMSLLDELLSFSKALLCWTL